MGLQFDLRQVFGVSWLATRRLIWLALASAAGYASLGAMGDVRPHINAFLFCFGAVFSLYFVLALRLSRDESADRKASAAGRHDIFLIIGAALLFRLILLSGYPFLSDDIYRYVWDGKVWAHGINPYEYAPADEALAHLRDARIFANINHPHIPTIYAPVLQVLFRFVYAVSPTFFFLKLVMTLFDVGTIFLLLRFLTLAGYDRRRVLIYAWNPLLIVETAGSGHIDSVGVFFLMAAFLAFRRARPGTGGVLFALATLTKFVTLLLVPFLFVKFGFRRFRSFAVALIAVIAVAYLPFWQPGISLFSALSVYAAKWEYNASVFKIAVYLVEKLNPGMYYDSVLHYTRLSLAPFFLGLFGVLLYRLLKKGDNGVALPRTWFILFGAICILSPTLHPWYLIWLIPMLALFPHRAWLLLSGLIMLSYQVLDRYYFEAVWQENMLVRLAIYLPFFLYLGLELYRKYRYVLPVPRRGKQPLTGL